LPWTGVWAEADKHNSPAITATPKAYLNTNSFLLRRFIIVDTQRACFPLIMDMPDDCNHSLNYEFSIDGRDSIDLDETARVGRKPHDLRRRGGGVLVSPKYSAQTRLSGS
jgi:hypothetical protein